MMRKELANLIALAVPVVFTCTRAAEVPKVPVPPSPYLPVVYRFADTMIERGRDVYGPEKTGLFLSALDRTTLSPLTNRPAAPKGVRESDRPVAPTAALTGANPHQDQNFLRVLYTLSELSAKPKYREAADVELKWAFWTNELNLLPWSENFTWDVMADRRVAGNLEEFDMEHDIFYPRRPWVLWERWFATVPNPVKFEPRVRSRRFVELSGPRIAGSHMRVWAATYAHTSNRLYLEPFEWLLEGLEKRRDKETGLILSRNYPWLSAWWLSLAIDCDGAAHQVPEPLAARLRELAAHEDKNFCSLQQPADLKKTGGFIASVDGSSKKPLQKVTHRWQASAADRTTAQVAMMCVSRYENTGKVAYRDLVHAAADVYLDSEPAEADDVWPMTVGHVISLEVAAWRSTAQQRYLDRARHFGDWALKTFFDAPLPRASTKSSHYESITGADTLALALVELHLHILGITAVRCPANTIDR